MIEASIDSPYKEHIQSNSVFQKVKRHEVYLWKQMLEGYACDVHNHAYCIMQNCRIHITLHAQQLLLLFEINTLF